MPIMFNSVLTEAGLNLAEVRLLRHKDNRASKGRSPYELWRDDLQAFLQYQSLQRISMRTRLNTAYWASFVVTSSDETMFVGIYSVKYKGLLAKDTPMPHMDGVDIARSCDEYDLSLDNPLSDLVGKLFIEWGKGYKAWVQRADLQNKKVVKLRTDCSADIDITRGQHPD
jgi:hypothetical protein